jgi:hypothetical protein
MAEPYNPLDKINLGKSVVDALLEEQPIRLTDLVSFSGAGIYAIYYHGPFPAYSPISLSPSDPNSVPIYAGKAVPAGSRRGASLTTNTATRALWNRLTDHRDNITEIEKSEGNLKVQDFSVRYLAVDDIWIPLGESLLISTYNPVWNRVVDGFGNHDPGAGRYNGLRPLWDVLHPGRYWAPKCRERPESAQDIIQRIANHFAST